MYQLFNLIQRLKFWGITTLLLLTRAGDLMSTYSASPDLSKELNPIHSIFGLGWTGLIAANIILVGAIIYLYHYFIYKYDPVAVSYASNFREYCSQRYFNRPDKFSWVFYRLPKNWVPLMADLGYSLPRMLIFIGCVATFNNLLIASQNSFYLEMMSAFQYSWLWIYISGITFGMIYFFKNINKDYSANLTMTQVSMR